LRSRYLPEAGGTFSMRTSCHTLDRVGVDFDDVRLVADAGLIAPATLAQHLGLRELFDAHVDLGAAPGRANVGHKAMTVIHSVLAGGDSIDDCDALRAGSTAAVLGHGVLAPSTIGVFLRSFTWGHARQLDKVAAEVLTRAWAAGAGPEAAPVTIDVDSSICETYGLQKQGATRFTYTHVRGYHPLLATVAATAEVLHARLRGGNSHTARGAPSFLAETFARARTAGATGPLCLRADSGFYSKVVVDACKKAEVAFSITAKLYRSMHAVISQIPEDDWTPIPYFLDDGADVAECRYQAFGNKGVTCRLIIRRTRPTPGSQLALLVDYAYHAFITDRTGDKISLDADHRRHAVVENTIRDLKYGVGLNHLPSGRFGANAAWLALNVIAHNMARWTTLIGGLDTPTTNTPTTDADTPGESRPPRKSFVATDTLRRRHLRLPGRITRSARHHTLHLPRDWPWADEFNHMLSQLRSVSLAT
jgi:DDE family transposase